MKSLTLLPEGGLGNRMAAIASAAAFCRERSVPLRVVWTRAWGMAARFSDLFDDLATDRAADIELCEAGWREKLLFDRPRRRNLWLPRLCQRVLFDRCIYLDEVYAEPEGKLSLPSGFRSTGDVYLVHLSEFCYRPDMYSVFRPCAAVARRIEERTADFDEHTVGLHIRRTDNVCARRESPIEHFEQAMRRELEADAQTRFYVATDDEPTKAHLRRIFGSRRIMTSPGAATRDSVEGIREALVEMYALAATRRIYGSAHSSFSIVACRLGGHDAEWWR